MCLLNISKPSVSCLYSHHHKKTNDKKLTHLAGVFLLLPWAVCEQYQWVKYQPVMSNWFRCLNRWTDNCQIFLNKIHSLLFLNPCGISSGLHPLQAPFASRLQAHYHNNAQRWQTDRINLWYLLSSYEYLVSLSQISPIHLSLCFVTSISLLLVILPLNTYDICIIEICMIDSNLMLPKSY